LAVIDATMAGTILVDAIIIAVITIATTILVAVLTHLLTAMDAEEPLLFQEHYKNFDLI